MDIIFKISAYTSTRTGEAGWMRVRAYATEWMTCDAANREVAVAAAKEIKAQFPKSIGLIAATSSSHERGTSEVCGLVALDIKLAADGVNGGKNETGIKRYRSLRRHLERLGYAVEYVVNATNSYPTLEAFDAAL